MLELHAIFHGGVQGVGFRATTSMLARRLGLKGLVRNKSDGSVEIIAQGGKPVLEKLVENLKSTFDLVDVQIKYSEPKSSFEGFTISP